MAERHVIDEIEVAFGQTLLAVEQRTERHAFEVVQAGAMLHGVVHREAVGRVEQAGMQTEVGQIVDALVLSADVAQGQFGIIIGDGKEAVEQTIGLLESHSMQGGHGARGALGRARCLDHRFPIFVGQLVLQATRHPHIVARRHGKDDQPHIGHHRQEQQEATRPRTRSHGRSSLDIAPTKAAHRTHGHGSRRRSGEQGQRAQHKGRGFDAQEEIEAVGHAPGEQRQRQPPAPALAAACFREQALNAPRHSGEQERQQRAADPTVEEGQQNVARRPEDIGAGQAQDVEHRLALGTNIVFIGDVAEHVAVDPSGKDPQKHKPHGIVKGGCPFATERSHGMGRWGRVNIFLFHFVGLNPPAALSPQR